MNQLHVPGTQELLDDAEDLDEFFISRASAERRLRGLSSEERLRGLGPEERLRGLGPEERLRGLGPEELLRGLGPDERVRLRELLLKQEDR